MEGKKSTDTTKMYQHLSDHNYYNITPINVKPNLTRKRIKKQLIITDLKAIYNCTMCGYRSMSRDALFKHICIKKSKHIFNETTIKEVPKDYEKCLQCNFMTMNKTNLISHMKSHIEGLNKQCRDCNLVQTTDMGFKCPDCSYTTKNPASLKVHMHIHSKGTPFKCTECNFSGKDLKALINHYGETKDLRCWCGYVTHLKRRMASHLRSHNQEKPFCCGICNFAVSDRAGLQRHMKNKHIID